MKENTSTLSSSLSPSSFSSLSSSSKTHVSREELCVLEEASKVLCRALLEDPNFQNNVNFLNLPHYFMGFLCGVDITICCTTSSDGVPLICSSPSSLESLKIKEGEEGEGGRGEIKDEKTQDQLQDPSASVRPVRRYQFKGLALMADRELQNRYTMAGLPTPMTALFQMVYRDELIKQHYTFKTTTKTLNYLNPINADRPTPLNCVGGCDSMTMMS